jgi:hypothetical protein
MKKCAHCKELKEEEEFAFSNRLLGTKQKHCRACMSKFNKASYQRTDKDRLQENRQKRVEASKHYVWGYLTNHPCVDCGESNPVVLEFDHVRGVKKLAVTQMVSDGYSLDVIRAEIRKCVVRCRNCHWKRHHKEGGWFSR